MTRKSLSPGALDLLPRLAADERGVIAILAALTLTLLMGFAGLAITVSYWEGVQRKMQLVADEAAYSAAMDASSADATAGDAIAVAQSVAYAITAANGFTNGQNNVTVTVPPPSGTPPTSWEVDIKQPQPMWFASLFLSSSPTVSVRSVATQNANAVGAPVACVLALDPSAASALLVDDNATLPSTTCGVAANSTAATALNVNNNASIAGPVNVVGQWSLANGASLSGSPQDENAAAIADPYAGLALPSPMPSCSSQSGIGSNNQPVGLQPGYFCSGWNFSNNETVTLAAGTYYVKGGITVGNNASVDGTGGVTIVLTDSSALAFSNNDTVQITAPSAASGQPYPGIAIMDLNTTMVTHTIANNVTMTIKGALYFPHHKIVFSNNSDVTNTGCTQIIADTVELANNVNVNSNCIGVGVTPLVFDAKPKVVQ